MRLYRLVALVVALEVTAVALIALVMPHALDHIQAAWSWLTETASTAWSAVS